MCDFFITNMVSPKVFRSKMLKSVLYLLNKLTLARGDWKNDKRFCFYQLENHSHIAACIKYQISKYQSQLWRCTPSSGHFSLGKYLVICLWSFRLWDYPHVSCGPAFTSPACSLKKSLCCGIFSSKIIQSRMTGYFLLQKVVFLLCWPCIHKCWNQKLKCIFSVTNKSIICALKLCCQRNNPLPQYFVYFAIREKKLFVWNRRIDELSWKQITFRRDKPPTEPLLSLKNNTLWSFIPSSPQQLLHATLMNFGTSVRSSLENYNYCSAHSKRAALYRLTGHVKALQMQS